MTPPGHKEPPESVSADNGIGSFFLTGFLTYLTPEIVQHSEIQSEDYQNEKHYPILFKTNLNPIQIKLLNMVKLGFYLVRSSFF